MALTMTRTRNQTTLTKLVQRAAEIHDELAVLERLMAEAMERQAALVSRMAEVRGHRESLYATLKQFDPALDPTAIGRSNQWLREYGRGKAALRRYRASVA